MELRLYTSALESVVHRYICDIYTCQPRDYIPVEHFYASLPMYTRHDKKKEKNLRKLLYDQNEQSLCGMYIRISRF